MKERIEKIKRQSTGEHARQIGFEIETAQRILGELQNEIAAKNEELIRRQTEKGMGSASDLEVEMDALVDRAQKADEQLRSLLDEQYGIDETPKSLH